MTPPMGMLHILGGESILQVRERTEQSNNKHRGRLVERARNRQIKTSVR